MARWGRSLFAIYDIDDMVRLDLPWWTFQATEKVDRFLRGRPDARVFEYGGGASTIWLAKRAGSVTSVEHDESWFPILQAKVEPFSGVRVMFTPPDEVPHPDVRYRSEKPGWKDRTFHGYVHAIDTVPGEFDVIVIDGRARTACLAHARRRLASGGLIVFDNSARGHYRREISASRLRIEETRGLTACLPYPDQTTLLFNA